MCDCGCEMKGKHKHMSAMHKKHEEAESADMEYVERFADLI
jgi:hypothetical protein